MFVIQCSKRDTFPQNNFDQTVGYLQSFPIFVQEVNESIINLLTCMCKMAE